MYCSRIASGRWHTRHPNVRRMCAKHCRHSRPRVSKGPVDRGDRSSLRLSRPRPLAEPAKSPSQSCRRLPPITGRHHPHPSPDEPSFQSAPRSRPSPQPAPDRAGLASTPGVNSSRSRQTVTWSKVQVAGPHPDGSNPGRTERPERATAVVCVPCHSPTPAGTMVTVRLRTGSDTTGLHRAVVGHHPRNRAMLAPGLCLTVVAVGQPPTHPHINSHAHCNSADPTPCCLR